MRLKTEDQPYTNISYLSLIFKKNENILLKKKILRNGPTNELKANFRKKLIKHC
jgi:hypothetical protein